METLEEFQNRVARAVADHPQGCEEGKREFLTSIGLPWPEPEDKFTYMLGLCVSGDWEDGQVRKGTITGPYKDMMEACKIADVTGYHGFYAAIPVPNELAEKLMEMDYKTYEEATLMRGAMQENYKPGGRYHPVSPK